MLAQEAGLRVPTHHCFDVDKEFSACGIERFDRSNGMRVPMHTAAGAAHADFRIPQLFNFVFHNGDDHSKNFSFLMNKDGHWTFLPVYDLTYNSGPNDEHQMDICGEARAPGRKYLLAV